MRLSATAARMRSFRAASSTLSPSWMSMARLTFPSRLELNRPAGSFSAAPFANVILTTLLYVSPVQTMPPWDQTGTPGVVAFAHFHSSTISGSASWMIARTFASVLPRQSPRSAIRFEIELLAVGTSQSSAAIRHCTDERRAAMKIKLTSVYVDDQEKALRFYTEVLGFTKKADF